MGSHSPTRIGAMKRAFGLLHGVMQYADDCDPPEDDFEPNDGPN